MIGYAATEIFTHTDRALLRRAEIVVEHCPDYEPGPDGKPTSELVRCHELARVAQRFLGRERVQVQDGRFGFVEHSWLWIGSYDPNCWRLPKVLDVYMPGALPQVQLVDTASGLPSRYSFFGRERMAVREDVIERLGEMICCTLRATLSTGHPADVGTPLIQEWRRGALT